MHGGSSSPARDRTWAPCIGSVESYPLDHQGSPQDNSLKMRGFSHGLVGGLQNGACQHQCSGGRRSSPKWPLPVSTSQKESQLPPASPEGSPRSTIGSDPGTFQITASALGLGACEILQVPFKSRVSLPYSPPAIPYPTGLQSQAFWGPVFPMKDPQPGKLYVKLKPLSPWGEPLQL